jgi:hypothetical protein
MNDKKLIQKVGSRAKVMHGNAIQTAGGLKKEDLKYNSQGRIVSKKQASKKDDNKKEKKEKSNNSKTSKKQKAGAGSDWMSSQYSRGNINGYNMPLDQFKAFTTEEYIPNDKLSGLCYANYNKTSNTTFPYIYKQPNSAF